MPCRRRGTSKTWMNECMNWIVEGDKTTTGSGTARGASTSASSSKPSKWKPHSFPGTTTTQFIARRVRCNILLPMHTFIQLYFNRLVEVVCPVQLPGRNLSKFAISVEMKLCKCQSIRLTWTNLPLSFLFKKYYHDRPLMGQMLNCLTLRMFHLLMSDHNYIFVCVFCRS